MADAFRTQNERVLVHVRTRFSHCSNSFHTHRKRVLVLCECERVYRCAHVHERLWVWHVKIVHACDSPCCSNKSTQHCDAELSLWILVSYYVDVQPLLLFAGPVAFSSLMHSSKCSSSFHARACGGGARMCFSPLSNAFQMPSKRRFGPQANMFHTPSEDVFQSSYERVSHAKQTRFTPCSNAFAREMHYTLRLTGTVYYK